MADGDHLVVDPTKITDILNAQADRLTKLETRVDGALNAAYVNYDPLVNQLSELRRELGQLIAREAVDVYRKRHPEVAQMWKDQEAAVPEAVKSREREVLADRDRLWCQALVHSGFGDEVMQGILHAFNEIRQDG